MSEMGRTLAVMTNVFMKFEVPDGDHWETVPADGGLRYLIYGAEPGNGTPAKLVAEFTDLHAVWFEDKVTLVKPEDDA
jgi:hypothetical protein